MTMAYPRATITAVILAGGRAERMGGNDKGLLQLCAKPLVAHVLDALVPQVGRVLINANRNLQAYRAFGVDVVSDVGGQFLGPLAGMLAAIRASGTGYVLTAPCDSPLLASDYATRMYAALVGARAELSVAHSGERLQPVFALLRTTLADDLQRYLQTEERKIDRWFAEHRMAVTDFADRPAMFRNLNTPAELAELEAELRASSTP